jgi:hypothetical protein
MLEETVMEEGSAFILLGNLAKIADDLKGHLIQVLPPLGFLCYVPTVIIQFLFEHPFCVRN